MNKIRRSKLERFKKLKSDDFIGRVEPIKIFRRHLETKPGENGFYDIFNIFGQGGVGKSYLIEKFQTLSREKEILTIYTDEGIHDTLHFMYSAAEQLKQQNIFLKQFSEKYKKFLQEKQKLDADPEAPKEILSLLTSTLIKGGLTITENIPGAGGLVKMVDKDAWASKAGELAEYIRKRWSNEDEVQLLLEPLKVLTPLFLEDLIEVTVEENLILFIDTYEEISIFLDEWLRDLLNGEYGNVPDNLVLVISGREEVNPNVWASFNAFKCRLPLEPFTEEEAIQFLHKKNILSPNLIETILKLSYHLPIMLAMLADEAPNSPKEITDFSQTAVDRFLKWIKDPVQRQLALHAALPRQLNKDVINILLTDKESSSSQFDWLTKRPFVHRRGGHWTYHPVVRDLMLKYLQRSSPEEWETLHSKLANYYNQRAELLCIGNKEIRFTNGKCQKLIQEKCYHNLLVNFNLNAPESIRNFVSTLHLSSTSAALLWVDIIKQCGEICDDPFWGNLLQTGMDNLTSQNWKAVLEMVSTINDTHLLIDPSDQSFLYRMEGEINSDYNYNKTIECYQKVIEIKPHDDSVWYNMGIAHHQLGNNEKASECFQNATYLKPNNHSAWYNLGITYHLLGNNQKACECFQKSIDINPTDHLAWYNYGIAYGQQGNKEKAIECYQKAIDINPNYDSAWNNMSNAYGEQGENEKAIECSKKAIGIRPDNDLAWNNLGKAYGQQDDNEKAIECFQKAIDIKPDYDAAWYNIGTAYGKQCDYEKAIECFQKAIYLKPDYYSAWSNMGKAYSLKGDNDKAIECSQKAIDIKPDDNFAWSNMGWTYLKLGRHEEALNALNKAWDHSNHKMEEVPMNLGHVFLLQGNQIKAMKSYQTSLVLWKNCEVFFHEMKSDYSDLTMDKYGISQQDFDNILEALKKT
ncbi:MAG: tetratricopeptide repeat protein [Nitrosomonas sp.]|uniref:tetratricopeptide repeat protein n=1 Tax=Nitrosomonas sp. TaxID=42353 RepID=UPI00276782D5|nr:tetratricopeptide repeat protein [Nitrosomonas sp.]MDP3608645.1 tetratricopeptide repeat protein [Methylophilus sp.]MDZ4107771.1 tetratricopeptide repeat protein [Nitrosomonas sp.]